MNTKLILVEGLIGSGKSAAAQFIWIQLQKHGFQCRWFLEDEINHPLYLKSLKNFKTPEDAMAELHGRWVSFVRQVKHSQGIAIVEACLFQYIVGLMLEMAIDADTISAYVRGIKDVFKELLPIFVNLKEPDVARSLRAICDKRGKLWENLVVDRNNRTLYARRKGLSGFAGFVQFTQSISQLSDRLFEEFDIQKITIDKSIGDWQQHHKKIFNFMKLPLIEDEPIPMEQLNTFTGVYTCHYQGTEHTFSVEIEKGSLVVYNNPYLWISGNRLIFKEGNIFYPESWPYEFIFEENSNRIVQHIRMKPSMASGESQGEIFLKQSTIDG